VEAGAETEAVTAEAVAEETGAALVAEIAEDRAEDSAETPNPAASLLEAKGRARSERRVRTAR
jgi:hypothetical protein